VNSEYRNNSGKTNCARNKIAKNRIAPIFRRMKLFKQALNNALAAAGKTAATLADDIGTARSRISEFSLGRSLPKDETLVAICSQFPAAVAVNLAQAWVRERLGADLADEILCHGELSGTNLERLYSALPPATRHAFEVLLQTSAEDEDLRVSLERLAEFIAPTDATAARQKALQAAARSFASDHNATLPDASPPADMPPADRPALLSLERQGIRKARQ
jgi:transcriptional regulator with XRE-family HTH domain